MSDLKIRAAKALGWKKYKHNSGMWRVDHGLACLTGCPYGASDEQLKFTTSRDWVQLLIDECKKDENKYNSLIWDHGSHELGDWLELSVEEICLRCVEVLEAENS